MQHDRFGELVADPLHGVHRVHRALEDDRRARPADGAQASGFIVRTSSRSRGPRRDLRAGRQEAEDRVDHRRLAASRLAGEAEYLALGDLDVHAPHRGHASGGGVVRDVDVLQAQHAHVVDASAAWG